MALAPAMPLYVTAAFVSFTIELALHVMTDYLP
jgi:hypothetical protein